VIKSSQAKLLYYYHDLAKQLSYYIFFPFSLGLTIQERVQESVTSHDECGKVVHRPCSSCISSVENLMGTPLSSPC